MLLLPQAHPAAVPAQVECNCSAGVPVKPDLQQSEKQVRAGRRRRLARCVVSSTVLPLPFAEPAAGLLGQHSARWGTWWCCTARPGEAARAPPPYRTGAGGRQPGQRPPRPLRHLPALPVLQDCPPWWADEPVDAIFAWYNASDPTYQAALRQHRNGTTVHNVEPNTGEIYLSIASVQRYAPWFRRIFVAAPANQSIRWVIPSYCWVGQGRGGWCAAACAGCIACGALPTTCKRRQCQPGDRAHGCCNWHS